MTDVYSNNNPILGPSSSNVPTGYNFNTNSSSVIRIRKKPRRSKHMPTAKEESRDLLSKFLGEGNSQTTREYGVSDEEFTETFERTWNPEYDVDERLTRSIPPEIGDIVRLQSNPESIGTIKELGDNYTALVSVTQGPDAGQEYWLSYNEFTDDSTFKAESKKSFEDINRISANMGSFRTNVVEDDDTYDNDSVDDNKGPEFSVGTQVMTPDGPGTVSNVIHDGDDWHYEVDGVAKDSCHYDGHELSAMPKQESRSRVSEGPYQTAKSFVKKHKRKLGAAAAIGASIAAGAGMRHRRRNKYTRLSGPSTALMRRESLSEMIPAASSPVMMTSTAIPLAPIPTPGESVPAGMQELILGPANTDGHTHTGYVDSKGSGYTSVDEGHNHAIMQGKCVPGLDGHNHSVNESLKRNRQESRSMHRFKVGDEVVDRSNINNVGIIIAEDKGRYKVQHLGSSDVYEGVKSDDIALLSSLYEEDDPNKDDVSTDDANDKDIDPSGEDPVGEAEDDEDDDEPEDDEEDDTYEAEDDDEPEDDEEDDEDDEDDENAQSMRSEAHHRGSHKKRPKGHHKHKRIHAGLNIPISNIQEDIKRHFALRFKKFIESHTN